MKPVLEPASALAGRVIRPPPREGGDDQRHRRDRAVAMGATSLATPRTISILARLTWNIKGNVKDMREGSIVKPPTWRPENGSACARWGPPPGRLDQRRGPLRLPGLRGPAPSTAGRSGGSRGLARPGAPFYAVPRGSGSRSSRTRGGGVLSGRDAAPVPGSRGGPGASRRVPGRGGGPGAARMGVLRPLCLRARPGRGGRVRPRDGGEHRGVPRRGAEPRGPRSRGGSSPGEPPLAPLGALRRVRSDRAGGRQGGRLDRFPPAGRGRGPAHGARRSARGGAGRAGELAPRGHGRGRRRDSAGGAK